MIIGFLEIYIFIYWIMQGPKSISCIAKSATALDLWMYRFDNQHSSSNLPLHYVLLYVVLQLNF